MKSFSKLLWETLSLPLEVFIPLQIITGVSNMLLLKNISKLSVENNVLWTKAGAAVPFLKMVMKVEALSILKVLHFNFWNWG